MPKAIVIVGSGGKGIGGGSASHTSSEDNDGSLANLDILGDSLVGRLADDLKRGGVESVTVFGADTSDIAGRTTVADFGSQDTWESVGRELGRHRDGGTDAVLIMRVGPYVELDVAHLVHFQAECEGAVIRAFDDQLPLDAWLVDPSRTFQTPNAGDQEWLAALSGPHTVPYAVRGYVNRLEHPRDFRRLVVDSLNSRCRLRPRGFEVRPGVWMAEGAQIEKDARVVAPAFIGKDVCISQQCLITRGSNIERNCVVDYGTVIENTSVLPNTYVGIGLDVCHSVVDGNKLLNLQRDVLLEIDDSAVIRQNKPLGEVACRWWEGLVPKELQVPAIDEAPIDRYWRNLGT